MLSTFRKPTLAEYPRTRIELDQDDRDHCGRASWLAYPSLECLLKLLDDLAETYAITRHSKSSGTHDLTARYLMRGHTLGRQVLAQFAISGVSAGGCAQQQTDRHCRETRQDHQSTFGPPLLSGVTSTEIARPVTFGDAGRQFFMHGSLFQNLFSAVSRSSS